MPSPRPPPSASPPDSSISTRRRGPSLCGRLPFSVLPSSVPWAFVMPAPVPGLHASASPCIRMGSGSDRVPSVASVSLAWSLSSVSPLGSGEPSPLDCNAWLPAARASAAHMQGPARRHSTTSSSAWACPTVVSLLPLPLPPILLGLARLPGPAHGLEQYRAPSYPLAPLIGGAWPCSVRRRGSLRAASARSSHDEPKKSLGAQPLDRSGEREGGRLVHWGQRLTCLRQDSARHVSKWPADG